MKPVVILHNRPENRDEPSETGVLREVADVSAALAEAGRSVECLGADRGDLLEGLAMLQRRAREVVVCNLFEGLSGASWTEASVAGLLEALGVPYTGNRATTLNLALDKRVAKSVLQAAGVATPAGRLFRSVPERRALESLTFPRVVKPVAEDASLGVDAGAYVETAAALQERVAWVLATFHQPALCESYLPGREFNVSVVGESAGARVLPVAEIVFAEEAGGQPRLVTHDAKWQPGSPADRATVPVCPAAVGASLRVKIETVALAAYRALDCRDYARVDLRLDERGQPCVLEVNPNPDIGRDAGLARALAASGGDYSVFLNRLVGWAEARRP